MPGVIQIGMRLTDIAKADKEDRDAWFRRVCHYGVSGGRSLFPGLVDCVDSLV